MRYINATGRILSVDRIPRDEESEIGGVRLELVLGAGILGDRVEVRATVESYCDDYASAQWLRVGRLVYEAGPDDAAILCHVSGVVHRSVIDEDGMLHVDMVSNSVGPDISILSRFPEE